MLKNTNSKIQPQPTPRAGLPANCTISRNKFSSRHPSQDSAPSRACSPMASDFCLCLERNRCPAPKHRFILPLHGQRACQTLHNFALHHHAPAHELPSLRNCRAHIWPGVNLHHALLHGHRVKQCVVAARLLPAMSIGRLPALQTTPRWSRIKVTKSPQRTFFTGQSQF